MELDFTEGNDEVGFPVIQMKHLAQDPKHFRWMLSKGWTFLLTSSFKPLALVRPLTEEDLEADEKKPEEERAEVMTLEMVRTGRDHFFFTMQEGNDVHLFFKNMENRDKKLALVTPQIPQEILDAYGVFREMQLKKTREEKKDRDEEAAKAEIKAQAPRKRGST